MSRFILDMTNINFKNDEPERWWTIKSYLKTIFTLMDNHNLLNAYKLIFINDKYLEFSSISDLFKILNANSNEEDIFFQLLSDEDNTDIKSLIQLSHIINISLQIHGEVQHVIDSINSFISDLYNKLHEYILLGPSISLRLMDFSYPKIKPPRFTHFLNSDGIIDYIHKEFFTRRPDLMQKNHDLFYTKDLPEYAQRKNINDDLFSINWIYNESDEIKLEKALMDREEWIYNNLNPNILSEYNKYGDKKLTILFNKKKKTGFFTYYSKLNKTAYKEVNLSKTDFLSQELINELKNYKEKGVTENGKPFNKIMLIVTTREEALAINEKAEEIGVNGALYLGENFHWNTRPSGNWRE